MNFIFSNPLVQKLLNSGCGCEKNLIPASIILEIAIILSTVIFYFILRKYHKDILKRYLIMMVSVALFELFTAPMWTNAHLGAYAYIYKNVSWILNLGWSTLILSTILITDLVFKKFSSWKKFFVYVLVLTPIIFLFEIFIVNSGIRSYAPEIWGAVSGIKILNIPVEGFYYIFVFVALAISFYKYWSFNLEKLPIIPNKKTPWIRKFILAFIGIFMFELLIDPLVTNAKLPAWSYIYRDISFLMSGLWILIIWLSVALVDKYFIHFNLYRKFIMYVSIASLITFPLEAWFMQNGFRVYGPSTTANFSGFTSIILHMPIEVAFAIPMYFALIVAFVKFWEINLDN